MTVNITLKNNINQINPDNERVFNISKKDTYCIGDSHNDLPMIKSTENSFTFTYSPQDVIDEAKYIVNNFKECIETIQRDA